MVSEKLTPCEGDVWRDNNSRGARRHVVVLTVGITHARVQTVTESDDGKRIITWGLCSWVNRKSFSPHLKPRRTGFTLVRRDGVEVQP